MQGSRLVIGAHIMLLADRALTVTHNQCRYACYASNKPLVYTCESETLFWE